MLLDANVLLYAVDRASTFNRTAADWLSAALNGDERVALPWQTIGAFLRISTHPRVVANPLSAEQAMEFVNAWLSVDLVWIPPATVHTAAILSELVRRHQITANLIPDAQLAALAIEHGLAVISADTDFARFPEIAWRNPLA